MRGNFLVCSDVVVICFDVCKLAVFTDGLISNESNPFTKVTCYQMSFELFNIFD